MRSTCECKSEVVVGNNSVDVFIKFDKVLGRTSVTDAERDNPWSVVEDGFLLFQAVLLLFPTHPIGHENWKKSFSIQNIFR